MLAVISFPLLSLSLYIYVCQKSIYNPIFVPRCGRDVMPEITGSMTPMSVSTNCDIHIWTSCLS